LLSIPLLMTPHSHSIHCLVAQPGDSYQLLDSGEGQKLEQWGPHVLSRPDGQVVWPKATPDIWQQAAAVYERSTRPGKAGGQWQVRDPGLRGRFPFSMDGLRFMLELTAFKHTGLFPEQVANWQWLRQEVKRLKARGDKVRVLNLFAYTGGATLAAAQAGADEVVHVDASKRAVAWARENLELSGLGSSYVRFLVEDVGKFVQRECRRGRSYQIVILDPPVYGRGPTGELWQIERSLPLLLEGVKAITAKGPAARLINAYTTGLSSLSLSNLLTATFGPQEDLETGELALPHARDSRLLPTGIFARQWR
jgi:23S rRNA (cytosine1962-C5)-methyltransferase